jgi:hypothetical protein
MLLAVRLEKKLIHITTLSAFIRVKVPLYLGHISYFNFTS